MLCCAHRGLSQNRRCGAGCSKGLRSLRPSSPPSPSSPPPSPKMTVGARLSARLRAQASATVMAAMPSSPGQHAKIAAVRLGEGALLRLLRTLENPSLSRCTKLPTTCPTVTVHALDFGQTRRGFGEFWASSRVFSPIGASLALRSKNSPGPRSVAPLEQHTS